jgi:hypothetical protein
MKLRIAAAGLALAATTAACGTHTATGPATMTVTTTVTATPEATVPKPSPTMVQTPTEMKQWVNAGQLDFYVDYAFDTDNEVDVAMYVKNTSGVPQTYMADAQMLVDDQGRLFERKRPGMSVESSDPQSPRGNLFDLNPGITSGVLYLYYTVPPGTRLEQFSLVVHGSHTSIGSPIRLHESGAS